MNRLFAVLAVLVLVVWIASMFRDEGAVVTSGAKPWPGALGTLESAESRFPPQPGNDAAVRLAALGAALPKDAAVDDFVLREIRSGELAIGAPPTIPDLAAIRESLLSQPIVWERHFEFDAAEVITRRPIQMNLARALVASALAKARANDASAWDDLRAVWILARSQDGHPQMMAQTAALSMARMINAVAWKLPLPAPDWLLELHDRDVVPALVEAFQCQTASYWKSGSELFPTRSLAGSVDHDRAIAETLAAATGCEVEVPMNDFGPDLRSVWQRAFRFRVEREAAANALRVRRGEPILATSAYGNDTWTLEGATLRYSRELPTTGDDLAMPLVLRVAS